MDFSTAYYAAVCTVEEGRIAEVEVSHSTQDGDTMTTLTVTIRRDRIPLELADGEGV